ncbi:LAQU0S15e01486g1_1 [Lachancea quebecensis]|uniref:LAQU0S15e01486g1_1 n=1 Tax=Lachancea quebecensis TaxID=1654605 RepID=A0A0P1KWC1_9SACH|nr:LAQU0S15e01486g1_1 [Lachancea quebecensis]
MPGQFPPSSPIAACPADPDDPFYQPSERHSPSTLKFFHKKITPADHEYPTPNPSSTLGRSSSPVKARDSYTPASQTHSDYELEQDLRHELLSRGSASARPIQIPLNSRLETRLSIGRKQAACDIVLPRHKNISRLHAFVTYYPESREVKLECKGSNGLVVAFPLKLDLELTVCSYPAKAFHLTRSKPEQQISTREVVKNTKLTSFVLLEGESVLMPYIDGTIIDFRHAECELAVYEPLGGSDNDSQNATETEDELQPLQITSDDFEPRTPDNDVVHIPLHTAFPPKLHVKERLVSLEPKPLLAEPATPLQHKGAKETAFEEHKESFNDAQEIEEPKTPQRQTLDSCFEEQDAQIPLLKTEANARRRKLASPSLKQTHKRKNPPKASSLSTDEVLFNVSSRGFDVPELQHILANHLAFSNVQQVPFTQLRDVNSTVSTLAPKELRALLEAESCIGVIYRQGKDAAGKPLDEEYYYDVENDSDENRRQLVSALKGGRSNLRSCRRVHKQYFWKRPAK